MLKRLLVIFLMLGAVNSAQSQVLISIILGDKLNSDGLEFGLDGGINLSSMSGLETTSMATNLHLGFYFDIRVKNQWSINTGVLVKSSQGANRLTRSDVEELYPDISSFIDSGNYSQGLGYFNVPIMMKYKFKNHFFLEAGPQISLLINARMNYHHEFDGIQIESSVDNRDSFKRIDAGIISGVGYKLRNGTGMNIGLKYYHGLVDISKTSNLNNQNRVFYIKVDIPIGKQKAAEKAAEKASQPSN